MIFLNIQNEIHIYEQFHLEVNIFWSIANQKPAGKI